MTKAQVRVLMLLTVAGLVLTVFVLGCTDTGRIAELESRVDALESGIKVVEAEGFRLVDKEGKTRAALGLGNLPDGCPSLRLYDADGESRAEVGLMWYGRGQFPYLCLRDAAEGKLVGETRAWLDLECLSLYDADGQVRADLSLLEHGRPSLTLLDAAGNSRAVVGCTGTIIKRSGVEQKHSESTITLFNDSNDVLWQAP